MKKISEVISLLSGILLILSYLSPNFYENLRFIYISTIVTNIIPELILILIVALLIRISYSKIVRKKINEFKLYFYLSPSNSKSTLYVVIALTLVVLIPNLYYLCRAKKFYYTRVLFSSTELRKKILVEAREYEKSGAFDIAISKYKQYIKIRGERDSTFIDSKRSSAKNRIVYANEFRRQAFKEYNNYHKAISQKGLSLAILADRLFPMNEAVHSFALQNAKMTERRINRIDSLIHLRGLNSESYDKCEVGFMIGNEITDELYIRAGEKEDKASVISFLMNVKPDVLEKYFKNSWRYSECLEFSKDSTNNR